MNFNPLFPEYTTDIQYFSTKVVSKESKYPLGAISVQRFLNHIQNPNEKFRKLYNDIASAAEKGYKETQNGKIISYEYSDELQL